LYGSLRAAAKLDLGGGSGRKGTAVSEQIVVEARGPHFVAWVKADNGTPRDSVLMVGRTAEEAEARLRAWLASR
jgi:hypothetical protein